LRIKNTAELFRAELNENQLFLRKIALKTLEKAINAVKPSSLMEKTIKIRNNILIIQNKEFNLKKFHKIYIIGGGKATGEMGLTLEKILSKAENLDYEGILNVPPGTVNPGLLKKSKIEIQFASHPIPNQNGLYGIQKMMDLINRTHENDLIILLLSGGGSALLPFPSKGINLNDLQSVNSHLLASGASIHEINTIRKHISNFKGGRLAKNLYNKSKATLISLIISDVVGDKLDSIASGPSVPDASTFKDAIEVLKKYKIYDIVPKSVRDHLTEGLKDSILETPKLNDECFKNVFNFLIGSVKVAVEEVTSFLRSKGFIVNTFSNEITGEAREFGKKLFSIISQKFDEMYEKNTNKKIALIGTGELTVTIKGSGIGGRNQEMLLSFLDENKESEIPYEFLIIGANLDGIEGNSEAMGALVDKFILSYIKKNKIETKKFLRNNDSNEFFNLIRTPIISGPTGCNVNDLLLILFQF
jgi:glycerate-2-kinase